MNIIKSSIVAGALAAVVVSATSARADIVISVNGTTEATDPTNTIAAFAGSVGSFNINIISGTGVNAFAGSGELLDVGALDVSTSGSGTLTILVTETGLSTGGAAATFDSIFSANVLSNISATRSLFLDETNNGLESILLGSVTGSSGIFSSLENPSGLFSLTEEIDLTANGGGAQLSADDAVFVPEPASLALVGAALVGFGLVRRHRFGKQES